MLHRPSMNTNAPPSRPATLALLLGVAAALSLGCAASPACRKGPKDDVTVGARTAGEAVKTGAVTAVEGVKTAGEAVGGWFKGGSEEAKEKWNEGKKETKETAKDGSKEVKKEADVPPCD